MENDSSLRILSCLQALLLPALCSSFAGHTAVSVKSIGCAACTSALCCVRTFHFLIHRCGSSYRPLMAKTGQTWCVPTCLLLLCISQCLSNIQIYHPCPSITAMAVAFLQAELICDSLQATTGGLLQGLSEDSLAIQQAISDKVCRCITQSQLV